MVDHINNGESGLSARNKLNTVIDRTNALNGIENKVDTNKQGIAANKTEITDLWQHIDTVEDQIEDLDTSVLDVKIDQEIADRIEGDSGLQVQINGILSQPSAGMVISDAQPDLADRVEGLQWLDSTTAEVWVWDGVRWLEFPSGGVGGTSGLSGDVDLSKYVQKPSTNTSWMVYKTGTGWSPVTTDLVATNSSVVFRDANGRFKSSGNVPELNNQLEVNRWFLQQIEEIEPDGEGLTYQIQTDKILRAGDAAIELVASDNSYTNVKFVGENGISVYSDFEGININGAGLATHNDVLVEVGKEASTRSDVDVYLDQKIDAVADGLGRMQAAISSETTVKGLREAIGDAIGDLINKLEATKQ